jgi:hypothetical protein
MDSTSIAFVEKHEEKNDGSTICPPWIVNVRDAYRLSPTDSPKPSRQ